jgi:EAL domain-containing protein (putative c-di-GMP-specific phosphodiesterase class I)
VAGPVDIVKLDIGCLLRLAVLQRSRLHRLVEHTAIEIIATGIETSGHARAATAIGVDGLQGFYFGAPKATWEHTREATHEVPEASAWPHFLPTLARPDKCLLFCY